MELPEEVKIAIDIFHQFEKSTDHLLRPKLFLEAFEILDDSLIDCDDVRIKEKISNLKYTYSKNLVQSLPITANIDTKIWSEYMTVMIKIMNTATIRDNPELENKLNSFWDKYSYLLG